MRVLHCLLFQLLLLISCEEASTKERAIDKDEEKIAEIDYDSLQAAENERKKLLELQGKTDSLRLVDFHEVAKRFVKRNELNQSKKLLADSSKLIILNNNEGYLYSRISLRPWAHQIELYRITGKRNISLIWSELWEDMTFVGDTIRDVNGDGYLDVLTIFYPSSGCCLRESYWVKLYDSKNSKFREKILFINPTFYPKEEVIRGIAYGHTGEVPLYKMKWKGFELDTIELIYPIQGQQGKFSIKKSPSLSSDSANSEILLKLPEEYLNLKGLTWFLDY